MIREEIFKRIEKVYKLRKNREEFIPGKVLFKTPRFQYYYK
jgi:hypothetical protein